MLIGSPEEKLFSSKAYENPWFIKEVLQVFFKYTVSFTHSKVTMSDIYLASESSVFLFLKLKPKWSQILNTRKEWVNTKFPHFTEFNTEP